VPVVGATKLDGALRGLRKGQSAPGAANPEDPFVADVVIVRCAAEVLRAYDVRPPDPDARAGSLSGGNQQKAILARELTGDPGVVIAAQPTRGVDVGAIEFIHRRLLEQRAQGKAILLISLELEEVRSLSDRIIVLYAGRIVGEVGPDATDEELGLLMAGREAEQTA